MNDETSESGAPIHRYKPRETKWEPPNMDDSQIEPISDHIERHIGKIDNVWHENLSDIVHIDVHQVAPTVERPYWTLVTSGMSDLPMAASPENRDWAYAELMICLPKEWPLDQTSFKDENNYWPIRWLKMLARFPHEQKTWLCWGHSMPNGDPAQPLAPGVPFTGVVLARPATVSTDFWTLKIRDDKLIQFFAVFPVYPGEMELKLAIGSNELERLFEQNKITEIVDARRRDVSQREWWRLW